MRRAGVAAGLLAALALALAGCEGQAAPPAAPTSTASAAATATAQAQPQAHGGHATASPAPAAAPLRPGERFLEVGLPRAYTPAAPNGGTDDYRCFLLPTGLSSDAMITGVAFLPGDPAIVHHAILYRVAPSQLAAARAADAAAAGDGWTCFGGPGLPAGPDAVGGLDDAPWLAAWAPGGTERSMGRGVGVPLAAGSSVVLQMHYNLRQGTGVDRTAVRLRLAPPGADLQPLSTLLLPAPVELPCLPGEAGRLCARDAAVLDVAGRFGQEAFRQIGGLQLLCGGDPRTPKAGPTQTCDRPVTTTTVVHAAAGHMHLLGRSIRIQLLRPSGAATTLLDIPVWDFDNQGAVPLPRPVTARPGDTLRVTCTHDASLRGKLPELRDLPPRYVVWGEGTTDEMCLGILLVTRPG